jgi:hypothetical protein
MKTATVRDLRNHYTKVLRWVSAGEGVLITQRVIVPLWFAPGLPDPRVQSADEGIRQGLRMKGAAADLIKNMPPGSTFHPVAKVPAATGRCLVYWRWRQLQVMKEFLELTDSRLEAIEPWWKRCLLLCTFLVVCSKIGDWLWGESTHLSSYFWTGGMFGPVTYVLFGPLQLFSIISTGFMAYRFLHA